MGRLFEIIDAHREAAPYPPSYSRIAEHVGVSRQTLLNWRTPTKLIDKEHLVALADVTGVPYLRVLDALLQDIGYLDPPAPSTTPDNVSDLPLKVADEQQRVAKRPKKKG